MKFTQARSELSRLYSRIREGGVEPIERHSESEVVLANADEYRSLLEAQAPFCVEVHPGDESVAAWVGGLPVHAEGATVDEALSGLAQALVDYAATWEKHLRHTPNHNANIAYVRRVQIAQGLEGVREMLERDAAREAAQYAGGTPARPLPA